MTKTLLRRLTAPVLGGLLCAGPAQAAPDFSADAVTDGALLGATAGFLILSESVLRSGELAPQGPGDRAHVLGMDRWLTEGSYAQDFEAHDDLAWLSWGTAGGLVAWVAADCFALRDDLGDGATDLLLYTESAVFTLAFTQLAKAGFRRPRPFTYLEGAPASTETDSSLSFFSGHTAAAFALASTAGYLALTRHDDARLQAGIIAGTGLLAATTGALRILGRKHFPSDVLTGALVGTAVGLLVPHLHRDDTSQTTAQPAMLRLGGGF